jgi:methylated-DNA-protein-cysteine methyltransferase-like protein
MTTQSMDTSPDAEALFARIWEVVAQTPPGCVTTYGDVAVIVGGVCDARTVGEAMANVPDPAIPWHRVINAKGMISLRGAPAVEQRKRLEAEGVIFDQRGRVSLKRYGWRGPDLAWAQQHGYQTLESHDTPNQPRLF